MMPYRNYLANVIILVEACWDQTIHFCFYNYRSLWRMTHLKIMATNSVSIYIRIHYALLHILMLS